jgi:hypothetical protein
MKTKYSKYVERAELDFNSILGLVIALFVCLWVASIVFGTAQGWSFSQLAILVTAIVTLLIAFGLTILWVFIGPFVSYPFKYLYVTICIEKEIKNFKQSVKQGKKHDEVRYSKTQKAAYEILVDDNNTSQFLLAEIAKKHSTNYKDIMRTVLEKAISRLSEQTLLANVAEVAQMESIRKIAIRKLIPENNLLLLAGIAKGIDIRNSEARIAAIDVISKNHQPLLAEIAKKGYDSLIRIAAMEKLIPENHQPLLAKIAKENNDYLLREVRWHGKVRIAAMEKLIPENHQPLLAEIAKEDNDCRVRIAAINLIPKNNQSLFTEIAKEGQYYDVRIAAMEKLIPENHQSLLAEIAKEDKECYVRRAAIEKLIPENNLLLLAEIAKEDKEWYVREAAINLIPKNNQSLFAEIAKASTYYSDVCRAAIERLIPENHQPLLAEIAKEDKDWKVRIAAIEKLIPENHQPLLAEIAKEDNEYIYKGYKVRIAAIEKLIPENHQPLLAEIAKEDNDSDVRRAAIEKLTDENLILSVIAFYGDNLEKEKEKKYVDILKFIYNTHKKDIIQDAVRKYNGKEYNVKVVVRQEPSYTVRTTYGDIGYDYYDVYENVTEKFYVE